MLPSLYSRMFTQRTEIEDRLCRGGGGGGGGDLMQCPGYFLWFYSKYIFRRLYYQIFVYKQ